MASFCNAIMAVIILIAFQITFATEYEDCGSTDKIISYSITDCDVPPCIVVRPGMYDVDIVFTAASNSKKLATTISARIGGEDFPWPAPNACELLRNGTHCPIVKGATYVYRAPMPVLSIYPAITAVVTWKLTDEFGKNHVCTIIPVTLI